MVWIHGLLQLMGGRHYMTISTQSSSQLRWQEQQEPDAKEQGAGSILLFCPAGCQGRVFGGGGGVVCGKRRLVCTRTGRKILMSGVHVIATSSHSRTTPHRLVDKCTHFTKVHLVFHPPRVNHRHNSAIWKRIVILIREENPK